jgi:hypothetical protein
VGLELEAALLEFGPHLLDQWLDGTALHASIEVAEAEVEQALITQRGPAPHGTGHSNSG